LKTSSVATELRELSDTIRAACAGSPCLSVAWPVVQNCIDHLRALAAIHEMSVREFNEFNAQKKKE